MRKANLKLKLSGQPNFSSSDTGKTSLQLRFSRKADIPLNAVKCEIQYRNRERVASKNRLGKYSIRAVDLLNID